MLTYIISLFALPLLCVVWIIFQGWLARQDPNYKGYKAGCGGCSRSCGEQGSEMKEQQTHAVDAASLCSKHDD